MIVRPTLLFIKLAYALGLALLIGALVWRPSPEMRMAGSFWLTVSPALLVIALAAIRHLRRNLTQLGIEGDRLRYQTGLLAKSTRTMELAKVQDVRVDQTLVQRILGLGHLSLETAGETSRITVQNIDHPQQAADHILDMARHAGGRPPGTAAGQL